MFFGLVSCIPLQLHIFIYVKMYADWIGCINVYDACYLCYWSLEKKKDKDKKEENKVLLERLQMSC